MDLKTPRLIEIPKLEASIKGFISVIETNHFIDFEVQRVFWIYDTPANAIRGEHAHYNTMQILIAVTGKIEISIENPEGKIYNYTLDQPNVGLYIPPLHWHTITYSNNTVLLVVASTKYDEKDYIRDYSEFKALN